MDPGAFFSKTLDLADLRHPRIAPVFSHLGRFALRLGLGTWPFLLRHSFRGLPFAVNGVLRRRFRVRPHKMWEYARGVSCVLGASPFQQREDPPGMRVLDFGGGATLPVFFLAHAGCKVICLDIDPRLTEWTNHVAQNHGWELLGSTFDLTQVNVDPQNFGGAWGAFDAVISFSVLEHLPKPVQQLTVERLARLLKPGGVLALTFDYGENAPVAGAVRGEQEVQRLKAATGLQFLEGDAFHDTGQRFVLDNRHRHSLFTFASLFLQSPSTTGRLRSSS